MNMKEFVGSKFLSAADYPRPAILTIMQITEEEIGENKDQKVILYFENVKKALVLNQTNIGKLIEVCGEESDDWLGQKIEIYTDPTVKYAGKPTPALRLRAPQHHTTVTQQRPPQATTNLTNLVTDEVDPDSIPDPGPPMTAQQRRTAGRF